MSRKNELDTDTQKTGVLAEQTLWSAMRILKSFTLRELWEFEGVEVATKDICRYLNRLESAGYLKRDKCFEENNTFHIRNATRKSAPQPDYPGRPQNRNKALQNMWNTMRRMSSFTPRDIVVQSNTPGVDITLRAAQNYCQILLKADYLLVVQKAQPPKRLARYRLKDNTGPDAPVIRREPQVYDPNQNRVRHLGEGS